MRFCATWLFLSFVLSLLPANAANGNHWAFEAISDPVIPTVAGQLRESPIDSLVVNRLQSENLELSPEAPPEVLFRRLHLDLVGLLPSPEKLNRFLADWQRDPEAAYAAAVDELLESPHFGEHWARHWLDLARYGDSDGYLGDTLRPWAWVYRDWVIDAINRDQPFDQFSIEQLAGDLLPDATQEQKIAVGFHRNNLKNTEAGADRELDRTQQVVNRVATTGTVWMGLTVACAECHDHKHDPISQKEFFELYAFFNNMQDSDISVRFEEEWTAYEKKRKIWEKELEKLERGLASYTLPPGNPGSPVGNWKILSPDKVEAAGTDLEIRKDGSILATGKTPTTVTYFVEAPVERSETITAFKLEVRGAFGKDREKGVPVGRGNDGEFILSMFFPDLIIDGKAKRLPIVSAKATHSDGQDVAETFQPSNEGWRIASKTYEDHAILFELAEPIALPKGSRLKFSLGQKSGTGNLMRHFQISTSADPPPFQLPADKVDPKWAVLRLPIEKHLANPPGKPQSKAQSFLELSGSDRRETFIHVRGDYTREGEQVTPGTLAVLPAMPGKEHRNRLDFARWLFEPDHPLTARVAANRIWQHLFGEGIVRTSDDFGTHGDPPSHPELLDWLAKEFQGSGWSRKALIRKIVLSSTYRQASTNRHPDLPNTLLWRQNSFRVPAETVRDIHLVASGLFEPKIGGPGVHPPLPDHVAAVGRSVKWPESTGPDRYRRGMYIFLKRTVLYPMLTTFDAPDTSVACSRREKTNTPMQALTLLNDPVFYECAETLGREIYTTHRADTESAIDALYLRCLNRLPKDSERDTLLSAHDDFQSHGKDPQLAMIATARVVMNLDEFISRD